jgi:hypothetical protein
MGGDDVVVQMETRVGISSTYLMQQLNGEKVVEKRSHYLGNG